MRFSAQIEAAPLAEYVEPWATMELREGDTFYDLADWFGISAESIAAANGLTLEDYVVAGDTIIIPVPVTQFTMPSGARHLRAASRAGTHSGPGPRQHADTGPASGVHGRVQRCRRGDLLAAVAVRADGEDRVVRVRAEPELAQRRPDTTGCSRLTTISTDGTTRS